VNIKKDAIQKFRAPAIIKGFEIKPLLLIGRNLWKRNVAENRKSETNNLVGKNRESYKIVGTDQENSLRRKRQMSPNSELETPNLFLFNSGRPSG
jgi:hypothetical protein